MGALRELVVKFISTLAVTRHACKYPRGAVVGSCHPFTLHIGAQGFIGEHFQCFHREKLVQGGDQLRSQVVALDNARHVGHAHGVQRIAVGERLLEQCVDFRFKLPAVPFAVVLWQHRIGGVFAVPSGIARAVLAEGHRLKVAKQRFHMRLGLLGNGCLQAVDDVGHVVL